MRQRGDDDRQLRLLPGGPRGCLEVKMGQPTQVGGEAGDLEVFGRASLIGEFAGYEGPNSLAKALSFLGRMIELGWVLRQFW